MKTELIILLVMSAQVVTGSDKGIIWQSIEPFCGQLVSGEPLTFPLEKARVKIYRPKLKYVACCEAAVDLGYMNVSPKGDFDLNYLPKGEYWIVANWDKKAVMVRLSWRRKETFSCDATFYNTIEVRPSAGLAEVLVHISDN